VFSSPFNSAAAPAPASPLNRNDIFPSPVTPPAASPALLPPPATRPAPQMQTVSQPLLQT
jgi:hypothetical protein